MHNDTSGLTFGKYTISRQLQIWKLLNIPMLRKVRNVAYAWAAPEAFGMCTGRGGNVQAKSNHGTCIFPTKGRLLWRARPVSRLNGSRRGAHADVPWHICGSSQILEVQMQADPLWFPGWLQPLGTRASGCPCRQGVSWSLEFHPGLDGCSGLMGAHFTLSSPEASRL